jgi:hypothetical protein
MAKAQAKVAESFWFIWRDNVTDDGKMHRLFFHGGKEVSRLPAGSSLKDLKGRMPKEFRLMDKDYKVAVSGFSENQSRDPLLWGEQTLGTVTLEYRLGEGEEAWFEVK